MMDLAAQIHDVSQREQMNNPDSHILSCFEKNRESTVDLVRQVPTEYLLKVPPGEDSELNSLLCHAGCGEDGWLHIFGDGGPMYTPPSKTKDGIIESMQKSKKRLLDFFSEDNYSAMSTMLEGSWSGNPEESEAWLGRERVMYLMCHETHHRGKIVLSLKQWGEIQFPFFPF